MEKYDHKKIEAKWQKEWAEKGIYRALDDSAKKKYYCLIEFPYPSGEGLHVGHIRSNTAMDIIARKRRAEGYNVLYPIGWDAFGLPTENYAIKTGIQPAIVTKQNTDTFRRQLKALGFSFDWGREINTTDPNYYKWTQWIFLQFYKKGLAYKKKLAINWCPKCLIGLANEEVVDGKCERCGTPVERREKEQWMLAITKYADRLDKDLDEVNFQERIKIQQRNWIGKSEGALIKFPISNSQFPIEVFTTRPDTLFGVTYIVLAPEYPLIKNLKLEIKNWDEVEKYLNDTKNKTEIERTTEEKEKTGVRLLGVEAVNPATGEAVPVWVADYVLANYGTGAVMAVPAHDDRDFAFATKYNLPIVDKPLISTEEAIKKSGGKKTIIYKLRDWVFSRQRYWGEPIPVIHCEKCGVVPVPEKDLPVTLPAVERYQPSATGESPLAAITDWVKTTCPKCGGPAKRETDTMPNWAGSSWYYLAYTAPKISNFQFPISNNWLPVDWYNGGMEHTTLHLLYSRFWHKFLFDLGLVPTSEPYQKRTSHGLILAEGGEKMSKSKGNVINPDKIVELYGADTLRLYEMFMGPFDQAIAWSTESLIGPRRFLEKVWKLASSNENFFRSSETIPRPFKNSHLTSLIHLTIKKVSEDIEAMKFNTAVSALMILVAEMEKQNEVGRADFEILLKLLAPFAPHFAEELWQQLGNADSIHAAAWPQYQESELEKKEWIIVVQINGVKRDSLIIPAEKTKEEIEKMALNSPKIAKWLAGKEVKKLIYVSGKLVNIVV